MSTVLKISDELIEKARIQSNVNNRSLTKQIEYWAKVGRIAEDNPDLTYEDIKGILIGVEELKQVRNLNLQIVHYNNLKGL